jgi:hypothetical protein
MNRSRLRFKYFSQLIRSSYQPQEYIKDKDDFASYVIKSADRLSRKITERLHYNRIKIIDHSQIYCETCILILHMNRRNLRTTLGDIGSCKVILGMMPLYKKMLEIKHSKLYPTVENFQNKFYARYLHREMEYEKLEVVISNKTVTDSVVNKYIDYLLTHLSVSELPVNVMKDIKESALFILVPYEKAIRNEMDKGRYLFVYKYLLFRQRNILDNRSAVND